MSYDKRMTYPLKFRQQVLKLKEKESLTYSEAAKRFGIGLASVMRWTKQLAPCKTRNKPALNINAEALRRDVEQHPDAYQYERAQRFGVSTSGIGKALQRLGVTRKKSRFATPGPMRSSGKFSRTK